VAYRDEVREMELLLQGMSNEEIAENARVQLIPLVNSGSFKESLIGEIIRRLKRAEQ